jgi:hypothetical protein
MRIAPLIFFISVLFAVVALPAQNANDSVVQGIVVVKRPLVPASYMVKIHIDYSKQWDKKRPWESRVKTFRRGYKAWLSDTFAPQPVSVAHKEGDSINPAADSAAMANYEMKSDRPVAFDYETYMKTIPHYFQWTDSVRIDSARFDYFIDAKGSVSFTPAPWTQTDSSSRRLESEALPVMRKLWRWYPAQRISNRNSKLENVACQVRITIYAYDATAESPPPILVQQSR